MRHLIAITEWETEYEGLLVCENGIVLKREKGKEGSEIFRSLSSVFPVREAAVCISGTDFAVGAPPKWRIRRESRGEAAVRSAFGIGSGAVLLFGKRVHAAAKEDETVREVQDIPLGMARMADAAIRIGLREESTWLRHALEESTGLPKDDIPGWLATLPEEKRLRFSRLIREGAMRGDAVSLKLVKEALHGYGEVLKSVSYTPSLPLSVIGPPKMDLPLIRKGIETFFADTITFAESTLPPVYGSVLGAAAAYKIPPDEGFRRRFSETYSLYV